MRLPREKSKRMATAARCKDEVVCIKEMLSVLRGVECVYLHKENNRFSVVVVVAEKDYELERRIFEIKLEVTDWFQESLFDFRVFVRRGRSLSEVVTPIGELVFQKTA